MSNLIEFNVFFIHISKKNSKEFYDIRRYSISPSKFYNLTGDNPNTSCLDELMYMFKEKKKIYNTKQLSDMSRGKLDEQDIVNDYIIKFNYNVYRFKEEEYAIWKEDIFFRGIPDGIVTLKKIDNIIDLEDNIEGIIECKSKNNYDGNINLYDYYQILGYMTIFGAKWCDFIVKNNSNGEITVQRVLYDLEEWNELYEKLCKFKNEMLIPKLKEKKVYEIFCKIIN
jgi:hypothetical protein